jgi:hypothetical protein
MPDDRLAFERWLVCLRSPFPVGKEVRGIGHEEIAFSIPLLQRGRGKGSGPDASLPEVGQAFQPVVCCLEVGRLSSLSSRVNKR